MGLPSKTLLLEPLIGTRTGILLNQVAVYALRNRRRDLFAGKVTAYPEVLPDWTLPEAHHNDILAFFTRGPFYVSCAADPFRVAFDEVELLRIRKWRRLEAVSMLAHRCCMGHRPASALKRHGGRQRAILQPGRRAGSGKPRIDAVARNGHFRRGTESPCECRRTGRR